MTFGSWLSAHGQSAAAIERLFDVFTVATVNAPAAQVSLSLAAMVFQDGLLRHADACDIGVSRIPLGHLHGDAASAVLTAQGGDVRLHARVRAITQLPGDRWRVDTDDTSLEADAVVLAVPHDAAAELLPAGAVADPELLRGLDVSPIVNVHVVFDRAVLHEPFVGAVGSPVQFVFDRTEPSGLRDGQYVAVSVSAADAWIDEPVANIREVFLAELARVLPGVRDATIRDFFVTRERAATFRAVPGSAARRLPTTTRGARAVHRRRVDRHRLAGNHGGRGSQRPGRGARAGIVAAHPGSLRVDSRQHGQRGPSRHERARQSPGGVRMSPTTSWSPVESAPAALAAARDLFDGPMRAAVAQLAPAVRDVAGYHFGWTDADGSVSASNSGKAVRPTLAVLSAQAVGAPGAGRRPRCARR